MHWLTLNISTLSIMRSSFTNCYKYYRKFWSTMNYRIEDIIYNFNFFIGILCFYLVKANKILIWKEKNNLFFKADAIIHMQNRYNLNVSSHSSCMWGKFQLCQHISLQAGILLWVRVSEHNVLYFEVQIHGIGKKSLQDISKKNTNAQEERFNQVSKSDTSKGK